MPGRRGVHGRKWYDGHRGLGLLSFRGRPPLDCERLSSLSQTKPLSLQGFLAGLLRKPVPLLDGLQVELKSVSARLDSYRAANPWARFLHVTRH